MPLCRFQQFFALLNMLTAEGLSESKPLMVLSNHVFRGQSFHKNLSFETHFFFKCSKFNLHSRNSIVFLENVFTFLNKCNLIDNSKVTLLLRE